MRWIRLKYVLSTNQLQRLYKSISYYFFTTFFLQHSAKHFFKAPSKHFLKHAAKHLKRKFSSCVTKLGKNQLQKTL